MASRSRADIATSDADSPAGRAVREVLQVAHRRQPHPPAADVGRRTDHAANHPGLDRGGVLKLADPPERPRQAFGHSVVDVGFWAVPPSRPARPPVRRRNSSPAASLSPPWAARASSAEGHDGNSRRPGRLLGELGAAEGQGSSVSAGLIGMAETISAAGCCYLAQSLQSPCSPRLVGGPS